jgi:hypothetical protein
MTEWRIKEISDLTKTSIRMLRHYDKIGLLKPSYRSSNGYRCYTAQDIMEKYAKIITTHHNLKPHWTPASLFANQLTPAIRSSSSG